MKKEILIEPTYREEQLSRWFLPSLLFHLLIFCTFLIFEQEQKKHADVIFFDDQEQLQQSVPATLPNIVQPPQQQNDEEIAFSINLPKSSTFGVTSLVSEETQLAGNPLATTDQPESTPVSEDSQSSNDDTSHNEEAETAQELIPPHSIPPEKDVESGPIPEPSESAETQPVQKKKRRVKNFWGQSHQSSSPINKKMSITTLAEGFLNYTKETRDSAIDINSKDLTLEPTLQKIGWCLQNSFHLHNKPIALNQDVRTNVTLHLEIDEKGNLLNSYLSPQTHVPALDRNLLRIAQGAVPFPPIPHHVIRNKKTFNVKIPIDIDARRGTHEYYFLFRG